MVKSLNFPPSLVVIAKTFVEFSRIVTPLILEAYAKSA